MCRVIRSGSSEGQSSGNFFDFHSHFGHFPPVALYDWDAPDSASGRPTLRGGTCSASFEMPVHSSHLGGDADVLAAPEMYRRTSLSKFSSISAMRGHRIPLNRRDTRGLSRRGNTL